MITTSNCLVLQSNEVLKAFTTDMGVIRRKKKLIERIFYNEFWMIVMKCASLLQVVLENVLTIIITLHHFEFLSVCH